MMKFKGSKMTKVVSGFVGLAMVLGPSVASAQTIAELQAQIAQLMAQLAALTGSSSSSSSCSYVFTKTLKQGMTDAEVMNLQKVLNSDASTRVAATGAGSPGNETSYFGGLTKAAVVKFQEKYASEILAPNGLTAGTGVVGASTRAKLNAMCSSMTTGPSTGPSTGPTTGTGIQASLDISSPAASAVIPGSTVKMAAFKITNNGSTAAKITSVKLQRTGIANDAALRNVYLYNGADRVTDSATVASGYVTFNDNAGIVTIPAMSSVVITVMVELDGTSAVASNTIGLTLTDVVADAGAVSGLPVAGSVHQVVVAPSDIATVVFNSTTNPTASGSVDPQTDYVMWQNTVQVGSRDALLSQIRFRQLGSVARGDLQNFRLFVGGTQVGSAVPEVGADGYVTFTFPTPVVLKAGAREIKLLGDIVGGSTRTFGFSIQQAADAMFWDSQLNVVLKNCFGSCPTAFSQVAASQQTINAGQLTITKSTDSPSGNVINQGTGVTLAKFDFKASGERLKVENLVIGFASSDSSVGSIRNGAVYVNGVQVGSTATIASTTFNFGSSLIVEPGKTTVVEVRGDVFDNDGTNDMSSGDTLRIIIGAGTSNVYKMSSFGYLSLPASPVTGNTLTVADGSMTLSKFTAMANQTVTVPQTAYKIGEFRITTGSTEGVNLSSFTLDFGSSTASASNLQDVYIQYGSKTTPVKSTVSASGNTYSINEPLAANSTMEVKVFATLNASITSGQTVVSTLSVSGTSQNAGNNVSTSQVIGQTITVGTGSLSATLDASTPVAALVVGGSQPKVASFKFTASNDSFTITELWFNATGSDAIAELVLKDGNTEVKRQAFNGTDLKMTGLNVPVAYNSNKVLDVYAVVSSIGTGYAAAGKNVGVSLYAMKHRDSNGVENTVNGLSLTSNSMYAYKTKPTISLVALPTTVLAPGTQTIAKFSVTSDAGGPVSWRQVKFNVTLGGAAGVTAGTAVLYDAANESTPLAGVSCAGPLSGVITCASTSTQDQQVSGTKTYVLKATVTGGATGDSVSVRIPSNTTTFSAPTALASVSTSASFIWSDESVIPHSNTSADWNDDYLVKNLPTDSQTISK